MARQGITEEQVFEAAEQLQEDGLDITSTAIRAKIGRGSYTTINPLLAKWKEASLIPKMPNTLDRAMQQLWAIAWKEAQDTVKAEREALATKRWEIELEHQDMLKQINQLEDQIIKLEDDIFKANETENALSIENKKLCQLVEDAITRVDDIFNELEALEFQIPPSVINELNPHQNESAPPGSGITYMDENSGWTSEFFPYKPASKLMLLKLANYGAKHSELLNSVAARQNSSSSQMR